MIARSIVQDVRSSTRSISIHTIGHAWGFLSNEEKLVLLEQFLSGKHAFEELKGSVNVYRNRTLLNRSLAKRAFCDRYLRNVETNDYIGKSAKEPLVLANFAAHEEQYGDNLAVCNFIVLRMLICYVNL